MSEKIDEGDLYRFVAGTCDPATRARIQAQRTIVDSPVHQWFARLEATMSSDDLVPVDWVGAIESSEAGEVPASISPATSSSEIPAARGNWHLVAAIAATVLATLGVTWGVVEFLGDNRSGPQLAFHSFAPSSAQRRSQGDASLETVNEIYQSNGPFYIDVKVPQICYVTVLHFQPPGTVRLFPFQGTTRVTSDQPFSQLIQTPRTGRHWFVAFLANRSSATETIRTMVQAQTGDIEPAALLLKIRSALQAAGVMYAEKDFHVQQSVQQ